MPYGKGPRAAEFADKVFMLIPHNDWISVKAIQKKTGLTDSQVRCGVAYIRDVFPELGKALISGPNGYSFSTDVGDVGDFRAMRLKTHYTGLNRTWLSIKPLLDEVSPMESTFIERQFSRVLEDIDALI